MDILKFKIKSGSLTFKGFDDLQDEMTDNIIDFVNVIDGSLYADIYEILEDLEINELIQERRFEDYSEFKSFISEICKDFNIDEKHFNTLSLGDICLCDHHNEILMDVNELKQYQKTKIGRLDIDGEYNTVYTTSKKHLSNEEIDAIYKAEYFEVLQEIGFDFIHLEKQLNIVFEQQIYKDFEDFKYHNDIKEITEEIYLKEEEEGDYFKHDNGYFLREK